MLYLLNHGLIKLMSNTQQMSKAEAVKLLGGSVKSAAQAIGCTPQAVHKWPDVLSPRIEDRVVAALLRMKKRGRGRALSEVA